ncbi:DUF3108 domain-containing protein [Cereibacter ovatus]|nr:DUF3108 domain-containing protein [Cereibacter ovatus]
MKALIVVAALVAGPASAQTDKAAFDLVLRGIGAGTLSFSGTEEAGRYAVSGRLQSGGLLGMLRKVRYDAEARGGISGGLPAPLRYRESADTGKRQSNVEMSWRGGVPRVDAYDPPRDPRPYDVDPATQKGTVDPLTALYAVLRDVEPGKECRLSLDIFDGRRRTRLALAAPQAKGQGVTCTGEFLRIAGYSRKDMAEKTRFPFSLTYAPTAEGRMRVVEVATDTLYGRATLTRR